MNIEEVFKSKPICKFINRHAEYCGVFEALCGNVAKVANSEYPCFCYGICKEYEPISNFGVVRWKK